MLNTQIRRFALIAQTIRKPILDVPLLCDLDAERAASAFAAAGYADEDIVMADSLVIATGALEKGRRVAI